MSQDTDAERMYNKALELTHGLDKPEEYILILNIYTWNHIAKHLYKEGIDVLYKGQNPLLSTGVPIISNLTPGADMSLCHIMCTANLFPHYVHSQSIR